MDRKTSRGLSAADLEKLTGYTAREASNWLAGRHVPGPAARRSLAELGITLEPAPRHVGKWRFPGGNWVVVELIGPIDARRLAMAWRRPMTDRDALFFDNFVAGAVTRKLGQVLELSPPSAEPEA